MKIEAKHTLLVESLNINAVPETKFEQQCFGEIELILIVDGYTVLIKGVPKTTMELDRIIESAHLIFSSGPHTFKEITL